MLATVVSSYRLSKGSICNVEAIFAVEDAENHALVYISKPVRKFKVESCLKTLKH